MESLILRLLRGRVAARQWKISASPVSCPRRSLAQTSQQASAVCFSIRYACLLCFQPCGSMFLRYFCFLPQITKTLKWECKKINANTPVTLRGSVYPLRLFCVFFFRSLCFVRAAVVDTWRTAARIEPNSLCAVQHSDVYAFGA
jgi:hypothetical protein